MLEPGTLVPRAEDPDDAEPELNGAAAEAAAGAEETAGVAARAPVRERARPRSCALYIFAVVGFVGEFVGLTNELLCSKEDIGSMKLRALD